MPPMIIEENYVVFVRVGGGREPIGVYRGAGKSVAASQEDAKQKCREDLEVDGFDFFAVLAEHCKSHEVQRALEAQERDGE